MRIRSLPAALLLAGLLVSARAPAQEPIEEPARAPVRVVPIPAGSPDAALGLARYGLVSPQDDDCTDSDYYELVRAIEDQAQGMLARHLAAKGVAFRALGHSEDSTLKLRPRLDLNYCKSYGSRKVEGVATLELTDGNTSTRVGPWALAWDQDNPYPARATDRPTWSADQDVQGFCYEVDNALAFLVDKLLEAASARLQAGRPPPDPAPAPARVEPAPAVAQPAAPARAEPPAPVVAQPVAPPPRGDRPEPRGPAPIVAVFDIQDDSKRYKPAQLQQLSEYLAGKLAEQGAFRVVPRDQLRTRLQREKTQTYQECYDMSCQIELGKAMAAEKSLATKLLRFGNACSVSLTLYDLRSEASEGSATEDQRDCSERELLEALRRAVSRLTAGR